MKLVEILARELKEWPEGAKYLEQIKSGEVYEWDGSSHCFGSFEVACDFETDAVTRAQWEAERARILAESQPERDPEIAEIVEKACGKRSKEDQALWDDVAIALAPAVYSECCKSMDAEGYPENWRVGVAKDWIATVDAFMAEREKRMKG